MTVASTHRNAAPKPAAEPAEPFPMPFTPTPFCTAVTRTPVASPQSSHAPLSCPPQNAARGGQHSPVEGANSRSCPSGTCWRDLPRMACGPESWPSSRHWTGADRRAGQVTAGYLTSGLQAASPIRTVRRPKGGRHLPDHAGHRYDRSGSLDQAAVDAGPDPTGRDPL